MSYQAVAADFICWLLAEGRTARFARKVAWLQRYYDQGIEGQQNDSRIASNVALLAAAFYEVAGRLADVWPEWRQEARAFLTQDLIAVRNEMVGAVQDQQPSQVFWTPGASWRGTAWRRWTSSTAAA